MIARNASQFQITLLRCTQWVVARSRCRRRAAYSAHTQQQGPVLSLIFSRYFGSFLGVVFGLASSKFFL
jgi:hypothetical protein